MNKPHLKRNGGYWTCIGRGQIGYGMTPAGAYGQWKAMLRPEGRRQAAMTAQANNLLAVLREWKPDQAH